MASNYTNVPLDLVAWHGIDYVGYKGLEQSLFSTDTKSEVCTGIQKLVQRWLTIFLTPRGSVKFDTDRGTDFMVDIYSATTENDVFVTFQLNNVLALEQLKKEEITEVPENETLESVTLTGIDLFLGNLSLYIKIVSKTGEATDIVLPVDTNPMQL